MAREYAKAWFSMFTDEHFTTQPRLDKLLYITLLAQPSMNYAGVLPLNFKRWGRAVREGVEVCSERMLKAALIRLERNDYVFTDDDTGEVLVRSFIRRDQVDRQPNVLLSALRFAAAIESPKLSQILLSELMRIELPEVKGDKPGACKLRDNLKRAFTQALSHLETLSEGFSEPFPEPFCEDFPEGLDEAFPPPAETEPFREPFGKPFREPSVEVGVEVEVANSPSVDGYGGEGDSPRPRCSRHPNGNPNDESCRGCQRIREWDESREAARTADELEQRRRARDAAQAAIAACTLCDEQGLREIDDNTVTPCDHQEAVNG